MPSQREILSQNLKRLIALKGVSQAEFARNIGMNPATVTRWMNHSAYPSPENIEKISDYFGVTRSQVDSDQSTTTDIKLDTIMATCTQLNDANKNKVIDYSEQLLDEQEHPRDALKEVPFVGYSAAGTDAEPYCADTTGECMETDKFDADAFVVLTGDSMEPRFHQGEPVFYRFQSDIENGEFAIVEIDGEGAICKQVKIDYKNRKVILHSLNPKYEDIVMDPKRIRILGKVIE